MATLPSKIVISTANRDTMESNNQEIVAGLNMGKLTNPIADEFSQIEAEIAAEKAAGTWVDSLCDYLDSYEQQSKDAQLWGLW